MSDRVKHFGIMTYCNGPHFMEKAYYKKLTLIGRRHGIRVFVFSPKRVDYDRGEVTGYEYRDGAWRANTFPLPDVVYDRCFVGPSYRQYKPFIDKLQSDPRITFLGHGLSGKWQVHQMLGKSKELSRWLPETHVLSQETLRSMLQRYPAVIIKPAAGTHGIGVVRIAAKPAGTFSVTGRNRENKPFRKRFRSEAGLLTFVQRFTASRTFLVQPFLALQTPDQLPFDVRVLVQKNGSGRWQTTGMAVRVGEKKGITSNLHGGGKAVPLSPFLSRYFPQAQCERIKEEIDRIAQVLPPVLESHHGRLAELGIDVGVDRDGHVWIIEVNSRPGRTVFRQIADRDARLRSISQPVKYAHYLMKERVGGY